MRRRLRDALALLVLCSSCTGDTPLWLRPKIRLETDQLHYHARHLRGEGVHREFGFRVIATLHNFTSDSIFLGRCLPSSQHPMFGVELVGAERPLDSGYDPFWSCVGHDNPIAVGPGEARVNTLEISGPNSWDGYTHAPDGVLEGQFRLIYEAHSCRAEVGCELPREASRSRSFEVRIVQ